MTTVRDVVSRAYRKLGITGPNTPLTADEMSEGVSALNNMISAWALRSADFSWSEAEASDDFLLEAKFHEGVIYMLASRLSPDYMAPAAFDADDWFRTFQAFHANPPSMTVPKALRVI